MTNIEEIIITANVLANQGKKPTVALVKARLTQNTPLPLIISTLKTWQHQSDYIAPKSAKNSDIKSKNKAAYTDLSAQIEKAVSDAITPLIEEITELKGQILRLEQKLEK